MTAIDTAKNLGGDLRRETFARACELAIERKFRLIIETGTYRGIKADGQSTRIWATLARELGADFYSLDIDQKSIDKAKNLGGPVDYARFYCGDSVPFLSCFQSPIHLLYLDSFDYIEKTGWQAQAHQVAEMGAALGKLTPDAIVLLDDCNIPGGGKALFTEWFLISRGWKLDYDGYQKLFVRKQ